MIGAMAKLKSELDKFVKSFNVHEDTGLVGAAT